MRQIWKKLTNKEYRDSYVSAHISNTIASQIYILREARGWSQKDLAKQSAMSQSRISALEDPNYENIEVGTLKRLASAFDVGLTVRFIPFSELAAWAARLSGENLLVPDFANDQLPSTNSPPQLIVSEVVTSAGTTYLGFTGSSFPTFGSGLYNSHGATFTSVVSGSASAAAVENSNFQTDVNRISGGTAFTRLR